MKKNNLVNLAKKYISVEDYVKDKKNINKTKKYENGLKVLNNSY